MNSSAVPPTAPPAGLTIGAQPAKSWIEFSLTALPGVDLLVIAGDVGSYQAGSKLATDDFGLGRFSPKRDGAPWPRLFARSLAVR